MSERVDVYGMWQALRGQLSAPSRMTVESLMDHARGYVWGAEDLGSPRVTEAYGREVQGDHDFPYMYGIYAALYELGQLFSRQSIQNAYRAFCASRDLSDYVI